MTSSPDSVVLVLADGVARDALRATGELLQKFGVLYRETTFATGQPETDVSGMEGVAGAKVIVVASADLRAPALLSAGGLPVIRVPVEGVDQATRGLYLLVPPKTGLPPREAAAGEGFATVAIGEAGAKNAALLVVSMLATQGNRGLREAWAQYRQTQTESVLGQTLPE